MTVTEAAKKSNKPETYKRIIYSVSLGREGDPNCCEQELTTRSRGVVKPESQSSSPRKRKKPNPFIEINLRAIFLLDLA